MNSPALTRLGVFGGRFDPPHVAHLIHARLVYELFKLDKILFVPAANPPHKDACVSFERRAEMTKLAIQDEEGFFLSAIEKDKGLSYTSDTLEKLRAEYEGAKIYLMIGRDEYDYFSTWHAPQKIRELAELIVLPRHEKKQNEAFAGIHFPDLPVLDISSSMIRERIQAGRRITNMIPREVEAYIRNHNLYKEIR